MKQIQRIIHENILKVWKDIERDYWDCCIPNESSFVNAFYHHLRYRLSALEVYNIRIFTEHYIKVGEKNYRVDMAVVKIGEDETDVKPEDILAIFEFKLKWRDIDYSKIAEDFEKVRKYIEEPKLYNCQFYVASIHYSKHSNDSFLASVDERIKEKITEMNAFEDEEGNMIFCEIKERKNL